MTERVMLTVYCYDIVRDRTRARVARMLEQEAVRVQDSVFEIRLTQAAADRLYRRISRLLDDGDKLRMYAIGAVALPRCRSDGGAPIAGDGDYWIV
jgi:CRISPR-associated protein Cas2